MAKKSKESSGFSGLTKKQVIGLGLIFIFIVSTIAIAVIQAGL